MNPDTLYIIIPYFNYYNNNFRISNLEKIISYYSNFNIKLIIAEGISKTSKPLKDFSDKAWKHIKYNIPQNIWLKENLINLTIKNHLPEDWQFVCWMDGDIIILDDNFVEKTINLLKQKDIIQMFDFCINRKYDKTKDGKINWWGNSLESGIVKDFAMRNNKIVLKESLLKDLNFLWLKYNKTTTYTIAVGYAWAINKNFYNQIEKLIDFNIVGGGDKIIASCIFQDIVNKEIITQEQGFPPKNELNSILYSKEYGLNLSKYYDKFKNCKFDYLNSTIIHLPHGDIFLKKYEYRHYILKNHNFNPSMLQETSEGVLFLKNEEIIKEIENYIFSRELNEQFLE
jgi:hypothetical protein